jgi:hypothetical protein
MEYQPIRWNFLTVVCSAAVGVSSLAGYLQLQHETQSWAKILFVGNIAASVAYALVFGKNFVLTSLKYLCFIRASRVLRRRPVKDT